MHADNVTGIRNLCAVAAHLLQTMPVNAATKYAVRTVLREAVNKSCPEYRGNDNKKNVRFISVAASHALDDSNERLVADHALPLSILLNSVYQRKLTDVDDLIRLVALHSVMALITKEEDDRLKSRGLVKTMPSSWDSKDVLARYKHVGIELRPNPAFNTDPSRRAVGRAGEAG